MIVERDPVITDGLPTEFESHFIEYSDEQALLDHYRKAGKSYATLKIHPIQNRSSALKLKFAKSPASERYL